MTTRTQATRLTTDDLILLWDDGDNYLVWNGTEDYLIYGAVTNRTPRTPII